MNDPSPTSAWLEFTHALTFQAAHNTTVVLRGVILLGMACGAVGAFLLLRKRSLVVDALSHAALPGVCVGFLAAIALGAPGRSMFVLLPAAAAFGLLGVMCVHGLSKIPRIKEDAAIGSVLSVFFAVGVVLLGVIQNIPSGSKAGLNQFIFGQAATMNSADANAIAIVAVLVLLTLAVAFKELKLVCFDMGFARSLGRSTALVDALLLALITTITVIGLHAAGAVLMVALLIIPPAAARFWTDRLIVMIVLSAVFGALACHIGTSASAAVDNLPTGPAIVVSCGLIFIISMLAAPRRGLLASAAQRWRLARTVSRQHLLRAMFEHEEVAGSTGQTINLDDLLARRAWTAAHLRRVIARARRRGEITSTDRGCTLTDLGRTRAARIVRTHRLWEHFLTTQADIAPSHVDRAADDIEHVLGDDLIRDLEAELRASGALPAGQTVPRSAHALPSVRSKA